MSVREWGPRPGSREGWIATGSEGLGARVGPDLIADGFLAKAFFSNGLLGDDEIIRSMTDGPVETLEEAKRIAERWLDEREAETKTTKDGGAA